MNLASGVGIAMCVLCLLGGLTDGRNVGMYACLLPLCGVFTYLTWGALA